MAHKHFALVPYIRYGAKAERLFAKDFPERVCKALNLRHRLTQGKSKLNTDVSKLRGKEKVRYLLVHDIARVYLTPSVTDWNSYVDLLRRNGISVKEKIGKSWRANLYYGVGKQEFWYKKLNPYLSRENLEKVFRVRSEKQEDSSQKVKKPVSQKTIMPTPSDTPKSKSQSKPAVIPPLPDGFMGARIAAHDLDRYRKGEAICAYICKPDEIVGMHYWIWYHFKTCQPRWELTLPPADRYIPDVFRQHAASSQVSSTSQSQGAGISLSSPSFRGRVQDDQGFVSGDGMSDVIGSAASTREEFKLWLSRHPGLSIDEALHRYRDEQKAKQRRKGMKL